MSAWVKLTNIAWFRLMIADEKNEAKRREFEAKLAEIEADLESVIFGEYAPQYATHA